MGPNQNHNPMETVYHFTTRKACNDPHNIKAKEITILPDVSSGWKINHNVMPSSMYKEKEGWKQYLNTNYKTQPTTHHRTFELPLSDKHLKPSSNIKINEAKDRRGVSLFHMPWHDPGQHLAVVSQYLQWVGKHQWPAIISDRHLVFRTSFYFVGKEAREMKMRANLYCRTVWGR
jgi:hypothetical protein